MLAYDFGPPMNLDPGWVTKQDKIQLVGIPTKKLGNHQCRSSPHIEAGPSGRCRRAQHFSTAGPQIIVLSSLTLWYHLEAPVKDQDRIALGAVQTQNRQTIPGPGNLQLFLSGITMPISICLFCSLEAQFLSSYLK